MIDDCELLSLAEAVAARRRLWAKAIAAKRQLRAIVVAERRRVEAGGAGADKEHRYCGHDGGEGVTFKGKLFGDSASAWSACGARVMCCSKVLYARVYNSRDIQNCKFILSWAGTVTKSKGLVSR